MPLCERSYQKDTDCSMPWYMIAALECIRYEPQGAERTIVPQFLVRSWITIFKARTHHPAKVPRHYGEVSRKVRSYLSRGECVIQHTAHATARMKKGFFIVWRFVVAPEQFCVEVHQRVVLRAADECGHVRDAAAGSRRSA